MSFFNECETCGHIEEDHAMDAPEGERECLYRDEDTEIAIVPVPKPATVRCEKKCRQFVEDPEALPW